MFGQLVYLFIIIIVYLINYLKEILIHKLNFQKFGEVSGKSPLFGIRPFCTPRSICHNNCFWCGSLMRKCCAFIRSTLKWKWNSSFLRKVLVFQKTSFKVKVLKTFKIASGCHIKTCQSKRRAILKIPTTIF